MTKPHFTLTVVTSADGFIARAPDDAPQNWASKEEQVLFFRDVEATDWAIMGRHTHEAADRPDRYRVIFSSEITGWQRANQLWLDPNGIAPSDLASRVSAVKPLKNGLILGGTRVHDWFLSHNAIDRVHLTIEPMRFAQGLPIFSTQNSAAPLETFLSRGFTVQSERSLNAVGTQYLELVRDAHAT